MHNEKLRNVFFDTVIDPLVYRVQRKMTLLENSVLGIFFSTVGIETHGIKKLNKHFNWIQCGSCTLRVIMNCVKNWKMLVVCGLIGDFTNIYVNIPHATTG